MRDAANVLQEVGNYGRFQKKMLLIAFFVGIPCGFNSLNPIFNHYTPEHHCNVLPGDAKVDSQSKEHFNASFPVKKSTQNIVEYSSCDQYNVSYDDIMNGSATNNTEVIPCQNGWIYYDDFISATREFNVVCSLVWLKATLTSCYLFSRVIVLLCVGLITDRFGRRAVLLSILFLQCVTSLAVSLSTNAWIYAGLLTLFGATGSPAYFGVYNLGCECTGPKWRNLMNFTVNAGYIFAYSILPLLAYFTKSWRILLRIFSVTSLAIFLFLLRILPESPSWLMAKDNTTETLTTLRKIAKENGYVGDIEDLLCKHENAKDTKVDEDVQVPSIRDCIKNRRLLCMVLILTSTWFFNNITYFGLTLYSSDFGGNIYLNCFFAGILELPACVIGYKIMDTFGRSPSSSISLILAGILCGISPMFKSVNLTFATGFAIMGKTVMSGAYYIVVGLTTEVFPTILRGRLYNFCASMGKIGAFVSPFIMLMGDLVHPYFPFWLMGISSIINGILILTFMPETMKVDLPVTINDIKHMRPARPWKTRSERYRVKEKSEMAL